MQENLRKGINQFVKLAQKMGMLGNDSLADMSACMNYELGSHCDIVALQKDDPSTASYDVCLDFPELPEDETDAMIELAGFLSIKLSAYVSGKKGGANSLGALPKDERVARARAAARARWGSRRI